MVGNAGSSRNPAAPSTPRSDRPVRDKPMYFGYCYDWMHGKCTAQQCKYLHHNRLQVRSLSRLVVEDEEGEAPRSPTPSPPDKKRQPRSRIDGFLGGAVTLRPTVLLWRVQLCRLLPQLPVGLHRVVSLLALAVGRKVSATRCSSPVPQVEVQNGTKSKMGPSHLEKDR